MEKRHKSLSNNRTQEQTGKPPAAKPLRSRWIPDDDPKPRENASLIQLSDTRTDTSQQTHLDWPLHMLAIYLSRKDRLCLCLSS